MRREAYGRIERILAADGVVLLDGGVASEVAGQPFDAAQLRRQEPETWAIYDQTTRVTEVHERYATAGCDVISTDTWGLMAATGSERGRRPGRTGLPAWTVAARDAVALARKGIAAAGRTRQCAVAFCLNDADPLLAGEEMLLELLWTADPPDLVLLETLPTLPSAALQRSIAHVAGSGMPIWISFAFADGPPETLGDGLRALEQLGVQAFLVNCIPPDDVPAHVDALRRVTTRPVGCYPNGTAGMSPGDYAERSIGWKAQGASIIGGCCGVGPTHVAAAREAISDLQERTS
jgi:S-methylmethionine-dependent homocysteine/selenocysteine methylase